MPAKSSRALSQSPPGPWKQGTQRVSPKNRIFFDSSQNFSEYKGSAESLTPRFKKWFDLVNVQTSAAGLVPVDKKTPSVTMSLWFSN